MRIEPTQTTIRRASARPRLDAETLAAITFVIRAETERRASFRDQQITLGETAAQEVWSMAGRLRTLAQRMNVK